MNFEKLLKVYPEANNLNSHIIALMDMVSLVDTVFHRASDTVGRVSIEEKTEYGQRVVHLDTEPRRQDLIIEFLLKKFPEARFIAEEKTRYIANMVPEEMLGSLNHYGLVYGVDPLDGKASYQCGLYEWSISVGVMESGAHIGGIIYSPRVNGGMCVLGESGKGVFLLEEDGNSVQKVRVFSRDFRESALLTGVDFAWQSSFNTFVNLSAKKALVAKSVGSCALGLACVAAGKASALVQPVQKPWAWFAGYPLVEEAGGKVQFYHYRDGFIVPLEKPDPLAYRGVKPNAGLIAGNPEIVEILTELLKDYYNLL
jgi:myo-inositol-1(or 4)-monophosphatase